MMASQKVVINKRFGGFGLSEAGMRKYADLKGLTLYPENDRFGLITYWIKPPEDRPKTLDGEGWHQASTEERRASNKAYKDARIYDGDIERDDPDLVAVVEELGDAASGKYSRLVVCEIPGGVQWEIDDYDGMETIREVHRSWG